MEKINQWLALVANLGVIAGIAFLAVEIQQNTDMMRAQTRDSITEKIVNWQLAVAADELSARAFRKGFGGEPLDVEAGEDAAFRMLVHASFRMWENEWYQYRAGLYEESEFLPRMERWRRTSTASETTRQYWRGTRDTYAPDFRAVIDGFVDEHADGQRL